MKKYFLTLLMLVPISLSHLPSFGGSKFEKQMHTQAYEALIRKAEAKGTVRIIMRLRMDFQPEGAQLSQEAIQIQRNRIAGLQEAVLKKLTTYHVSSIKRYQSIPALAAEVDAAALKALITFPEVIHIGEDMTVPPLGTMNPDRE